MMNKLRLFTLFSFKCEPKYFYWLVVHMHFDTLYKYSVHGHDQHITEKLDKSHDQLAFLLAMGNFFSISKAQF